MEIMEPEIERATSCSWWWRRTMVERSLIGILIIAVFVIICLLGVVVDLKNSSVSNSNMPNNDTVRPHCQTDTCIQEAAVLISCMNKTIDPCDDFYEFACGSFIQEAHIPDDQTDAYPAGHNKDLVEFQLLSIINRPSNSTGIEPYAMLRKMYAACMDTNDIEESGLDHMNLLLTKLGGWPIIQGDAWVETDWINITQRLRQYGFRTDQFMELDININLKNSTEYVVIINEWKHEEIGMMNLRLGLRDTMVKKYSNFLIDLAVLFGAERVFATKEVEAVINFRSKLSRITVTRLKYMELTIHANITTIHELQEQYPCIQWLDVLNIALAIPNVTLTNQTRVSVVAPTYISQFVEIIKRTPKRVQVNHALLEIVRSRINCLPKIFGEMEQRFLAYAADVTERPVRWRTCLNMVTDHFGVALDALYIREHRNDNAKVDVTEMVSNIKNVFVSRLKKMDWMDNGTKARAAEKAEMISALIAYPDELHNESNIVKYYKGLNFSSQNILGIINQVSKFLRDKQLSYYRNPVIKNHWSLKAPAITSNAFYDQRENSIHIPFGIMQNENYKFGRPMFMNYGGLGFVIAHEITHGFDNYGKWFNKMGDVSDWWSKSMYDAYYEKAYCLVEQYHNYRLPGINFHLDGKNTLAENIADTGGVKDAYLAYLAWMETHEEELPLPGLNLTVKQLFWVSFANTWCVKQSQSSLEAMIFIDDHAPDRFRVLGALSNTKYFSEDFNCPLGSNMNPLKKCEVW